MAERFVAVAGFDPGIAHADSVRIGDRLYLMDGMRLLAVDLVAPSLLWTRAWKRPDPIHYQVPRRPHSHGRRLWSGGDSIVCLIDTESGVAAICCDPMSGQDVWRREIATPPQADWTEAKPAWPGAPTEEIRAGLLVHGDLAVVFARTTRRSMRSSDIPIPPLRAQLDVHALNPADGTIIASLQVPDVHTPILEQRRLGRWLVADRRLLELDSAAGSVRTIAEVPHEPSWPRERGRKLTVAWQGRGVISAATLDAGTGTIETQGNWKRRAVKRVDLWRLPDAMALQVNDQFVNLLDDGLVSQWEVRVRPYVYGVAAHAGAPVFVAAAGGGGGLYGFRRNDGLSFVEMKLSGGAWDPIAVTGTGHVAAACVHGLVIAKSRGAGVEADVTAVPGARALVEAGEGRVALLCGDPSPGIHVVGVM